MRLQSWDVLHNAWEKEKSTFQGQYTPADLKIKWMHFLEFLKIDNKEA